MQSLNLIGQTWLLVGFKKQKIGATIVFPEDLEHTLFTKLDDKFTSFFLAFGLFTLPGRSYFPLLPPPFLSAAPLATASGASASTASAGTSSSFKYFSNNVEKAIWKKVLNVILLILPQMALVLDAWCQACHIINDLILHIILEFEVSNWFKDCYLWCTKLSKTSKSWIKCLGYTQDKFGNVQHF